MCTNVYTLFAAAQTGHVYIYDNHGTEIHKLSDHTDPFALQFLPYHWLLASVGRGGWLKYQDTSTGALVSKHRTRLGTCQVMRQNPQNAVMHLGHANGTVTLWSPASSDYLVKLLCHKGSKITSLAVDLTGNYMVAGGNDRRVKVWDLRMFRETHSYFTAAGVPTSLDISQRGILGIGHAGHATFGVRKPSNARYPIPPCIMPCPPVDQWKRCAFDPMKMSVGLDMPEALARLLYQDRVNPISIRPNTMPIHIKIRSNDAKQKYVRCWISLVRI